MPEGDTIFRAARALHRALAGRIVVRFESVLPALTRVDHDRPLAGRTIESVAARGKHLLMTFSGDLILHTHMRMSGAWHIYPLAAPWRRPRREMRVLIATADVVAVGFNVPIAEFLTPRDLARHRELRALGPDVLDAAFDAADARRRARLHAAEAIGDVLINQQVVAGIGNVLKSESLFAARIDPFARVGDLDDAALDRVIATARELTAVSARGPMRATTRSLDPNAKLWVYGRGGLPCRKCGTVIRSRKTGVDARLTYWCPECQAARRVTTERTEE